MQKKNNPKNINDVTQEIETSPAETLQTKTNEELVSNLEKMNEIRFYSELTPENFGTSGYRKFELKNINPTDKSLELNGKVYKYWDGSFAGGKGPDGLFYCDFGLDNNESFIVGEFQDGKIQKGFVNYSFTQPIKYEAGEFEEGGYGYLTNGKRVRRDGTIEEGEFENGELSGGKRVYPDGKMEIVFAR